MVFSLFLLCSVMILPQGDAVFDHPLDSLEQPAFEAVSQRLEAVKVLRADFSQEKHIAALRRPLKSSGTYLFSVAHGVAWQIDTPFPTLFVVTEKGILQKAEGEEPFLIEASQQPVVSGFTKVFLSLFQGDRNVLQDRFKLYFQGEADDWTLGLEPKGVVMKKFLSRIVLKGGAHLTTITFLEASGDTTHIFFENVTTDQPSLSEAEVAQFDF